MPEPENNSIKQYEWMIRPCAIYMDEYMDCKTIKARFHQYYIHGESIDCSQWKTDYKNCCLWDNDRNDNAYDELIKSEKIRRYKRLKGHYANNVWERRDKPPENWNAPLPEWMEKRNAKSQLVLIRDKLKENGEYFKWQNSSCTIM